MKIALVYNERLPVTVTGSAVPVAGSIGPPGGPASGVSELTAEADPAL